MSVSIKQSGAEAVVRVVSCQQNRVMTHVRAGGGYPVAGRAPTTAAAPTALIDAGRCLGRMAARVPLAVQQQLVDGPRGGRGRLVGVCGHGGGDGGSA